MTYVPHPNDLAWWKRFRQLLKLLDTAPAAGEQLAVIHPDDLPKAKTADVYVACPRRGLHLRLNECWACWCDGRQWPRTRRQGAQRAIQEQQMSTQYITPPMLPLQHRTATDEKSVEAGFRASCAWPSCSWNSPVRDTAGLAGADLE